MEDHLKIYSYIENILSKSEGSATAADPTKKLETLIGDLDDASFHTFIEMICKEFAKNEGSTKFDLCEMISYSLTLNPSYCMSQEQDASHEWRDNVVQGLNDIFRSRLSKDLRLPAMQLVSVLLRLHSGFSWLTYETGEKPKAEKNVKLFELLSRLTCVEIVIGLDATPVDSPLMNSCFTILEYVILALIGESCQKFVASINSDNLFNQIKAIRETMSSLLGYLNEVKESWNAETNSDTSFILGVIRLIGVWVSEETDVLLEEIRLVLPFIVKIFIHEKEKSSESSAISHIIVTALHSLSDDPDTVNCLKNDENAATFRDLLQSCDYCKNMDDLCTSLHRTLS